MNVQAHRGGSSGAVMRLLASRPTTATGADSEITAQAWGPSPRGRRRATSHDPSCRSVHPPTPGCTPRGRLVGGPFRRGRHLDGQTYFRGAFVTLTSTIRRRARTPLMTAAGALALVGAGVPALASAATARHDASETTTPIKHLVVIFQENVSFDHYFATYPQAANPPASRASPPRPDTPERQRAERVPAGAEQPELGPAVPARPEPRRRPATRTTTTPTSRRRSTPG